jgi:hypothetical protein
VHKTRVASAHTAFRICLWRKFQNGTKLSFAQRGWWAVDLVGMGLIWCRHMLALWWPCYIQVFQKRLSSHFWALFLHVHLKLRAFAYFVSEMFAFPWVFLTIFVQLLYFLFQSCAQLVTLRMIHQLTHIKSGVDNLQAGSGPRQVSVWSVTWFGNYTVRKGKTFCFWGEHWHKHISII